ncbi:MipA/OmpV family protein [Pinisolibacter sp. B13]|nr:MipA/OmpV family protein [Pinisolibacter aquiterrae]
MQPYRHRQEGGRPPHRGTVRVKIVALAAAALFAPAAARGADIGLGFDNASTPAATSDQAQPSRIDRAFSVFHEWKVVVGAAAFVLPEYEGSDKFRVLPFPIVSASYGDWAHLDTSGLTVDVYKDGGFRIGVKAGYEFGRKESDSNYLRGLGDVGAGGIVGGIVSYETGPFKIYAELDKTFGGSDGLTGKLGASASYRYDRFLFSADAFATLADDKYMEAYFGVNANQSARSGLPEYTAKAGLKRVDLKGSVTYLVTENWSVTGAAGAGLLMGDARNSPIVRDKIQPFARIGAAYRF